MTLFVFHQDQTFPQNTSYGNDKKYLMSLEKKTKKYTNYLYLKRSESCFGQINKLKFVSWELIHSHKS